MTAIVWAIAVVIIIAIIGFAEVRKARHHAMGHEKAVPDQVKREMEELRERVKVLERIATDDGDTKRLSVEIENLREE